MIRPRKTTQSTRNSEDPEDLSILKFQKEIATHKQQVKFFRIYMKYMIYQNLRENKTITMREYKLITISLFTFLTTPWLSKRNIFQRRQVEIKETQSITWPQLPKPHAIKILLLLPTMILNLMVLLQKIQRGLKLPSK